MYQVPHYDFIVVGGGVGGTCAAAMLTQKGHRVLLLEKEPYLGGCSSTFSHQGFRYNTGATTFAGFAAGLEVYDFFQNLGICVLTSPLEAAFVQVQGGAPLPRYEALALFLEALETAHPHPKNRIFWEEIARINSAFYRHKGYYFSKGTLGKMLRSLTSFWPLAKAFGPLFLEPATSYLSRKLPNLTPAYLKALDAQVRIVSQTSLAHMNALSAILALGYPFLANAYVWGGMGSLFEALEKNIYHVQTATPVNRIVPCEGHYEVHTKKALFHATNVVLNLPVFECAKFFPIGDMAEYFARFKPLNNGQSAFMLYATFCTDKPLAHHYQLLLETPLPFTTSDALFVSFSDQRDTSLAPQGHYSMTLSVHTQSSWWNKKDILSYKNRKAALVSQLLDEVCARLGLEKTSVVHHFGATPATFARYLGRSQLGGIPMSYTRPFFRNPANDTPFRGLYTVGDTTFAAQGWPGVIAGVRSLEKILDARPSH